MNTLWGQLLPEGVLLYRYLIITNGRLRSLRRAAYCCSPCGVPDSMSCPRTLWRPCATKVMVLYVM